VLFALGGAELPERFLWTPLALWVALLVWSAVKLPRLSAPALGAVGVAVLALTHAPWNELTFALALTVGAVSLGASARAHVRPGPAILLASVPLMAWVVGYFLGPDHLAAEAGFRRELMAGQQQWLELFSRFSRLDAPTGDAKQALNELLKRVVDANVLLMPTPPLAQAPALMAWGYSLAAVAMEGGEHELRPLPAVSRMRLPDGAVWLLCLALFLLVVRRPALLRTGANLGALMAVAYFCQGISILAFMALALRVVWLTAAALLALALLLVFTPFSLFACVLGLADIWLDFRRLGSAPENVNS